MGSRPGRPNMHNFSGKAAMNPEIEVLDLTGDDDPLPLPSKPTVLQRIERPISTHANASTATAVQKSRGYDSRAYQPPPSSQQHYTHPVQPSTSKAPRKRKEPPAKSTPSPKRKKADPPTEKRLKRWRPYPPQSYAEIRQRALTQRMFVVDRQRTTSSDATHQIEIATLVGTTGNVYTVTISQIPHCDCPHARKGNQCKHIVYVLSRVLRAPPHLEYQLALTASELVEIFTAAPPLPSETAQDSSKDGNRKAVEGECPICCDDLVVDQEAIVWCRAACGNNIHRTCFERWAQSNAGQRSVTCPFCRAAWQADEADPKVAVAKGRKNAEGYVNVAAVFGLSGRRDYSSYHDRWVARQMRDGGVDDDGFGYDPDGYDGYDYDDRGRYY